MFKYKKSFIKKTNRRFFCDFSGENFNKNYITNVFSENVTNIDLKIKEKNKILQNIQFQIKNKNSFYNKTQLREQETNLELEISILKELRDLSLTFFDNLIHYKNLFSLWFYQQTNSIQILLGIIIGIMFSFLGGFLFFNYFVYFKTQIIEFRNIPFIKLILNNLIIASLFLIFIKLIFPTTLFIRILLLFCFLLIACKFNIRQKIKIPIGWLLEKLLGYEFINRDFPNEKKDIYFQSKIHNKKYKYLYRIWFEVSWFLRKVFHRFYFFLCSIRFFFDIHPILYIMLYYSLFFYIIFLNQAITLSYLGLFMIMTRLLVYVHENNYGEFVKSLTEDNNNLKLYEKKLKFTRNNIMIFMFWNIRNLYYRRRLALFFPQILKYKNNVTFVFNRSAYNFGINLKENETEVDLPLRYTQKISIFTVIENSNKYLKIIETKTLNAKNRENFSIKNDTE